MKYFWQIAAIFPISMYLMACGSDGSSNQKSINKVTDSKVIEKGLTVTGGTFNGVIMTDAKDAVPQGTREYVQGGAIDNSQALFCVLEIKFKLATPDGTVFPGELQVDRSNGLPLDIQNFIPSETEFKTLSASDYNIQFETKAPGAARKYDPDANGGTMTIRKYEAGAVDPVNPNVHNAGFIEGTFNLLFKNNENVEGAFNVDLQSDVQPDPGC